MTGYEYTETELVAERRAIAEINRKKREEELYALREQQYHAQMQGDDDDEEVRADDGSNLE